MLNFFKKLRNTINRGIISVTKSPLFSYRQEVSIMAKYTAPEIARWFIMKDNSISEQFDSEIITPLKLQKLLYYAQGICMGFFDDKEKYLFDDDFLAWAHGPVVRSVWENYNGKEPIKYEEIEGDDEIFQKIKDDNDTSRILEMVYGHYGKYTAWYLRNLSHDEPPWNETLSNRIISKDKMYQYFRTVFEETSAEEI